MLAINCSRSFPVSVENSKGFARSFSMIEAASLVKGLSPASSSLILIRSLAKEC